MTLFFRHDIIYQHLTTGWEQEDVVAVADEEPREYGTPVVRRKPVFYSDLNTPVPDDIALEEPGWQQAPPPPVVLPVKVGPSTSVGDLFEEEFAEDPRQYDTPVIRRIPVFYSDLNNPVPEQIDQDPGWDQAPPPPVVRRIPVFYSDWVIGEEIALEEPGWHQAFLPSLVVHPPVFFPRTEEVLDEIDQDPGWDQAPPPPVVRRIPVFFSTSVIGDEVPLIESGWDQSFLPPLVVHPPVFFPRTEEVLDEIALEEPGWHQAPPPPIVLPRKVPPSTSVGDLFSVVVVVEESGWNQAYLPPLVVHPFGPAFRIHQDLEQPVTDEIREDPGWDQAPPPPVVRRIPVFYSDWVIGEEIETQEPGWDQAPPPIVVRRKLVFYSDLNNPVMGATTVELTYTLDAILGPLAPPGLRRKELRLKELSLKELRTRFIRRD